MSVRYKVFTYVIIALSISSCMSTRDKAAYLRSHILKLGEKYNLKVDYPTYENMTGPAKKTIAHSSRKDLKLSLDSVERQMVIMPDSIKVILSVSYSDSPKVVVDSTIKDKGKCCFITNKKKIKYIREHHITVPDNYVVDTLSK